MVDKFNIAFCIGNYNCRRALFNSLAQGFNLLFGHEPFGNIVRDDQPGFFRSIINGVRGNFNRNQFTVLFNMAPCTCLVIVIKCNCYIGQQCFGVFFGADIL